MTTKEQIMELVKQYYKENHQKRNIIQVTE